jgi:chromatin assembly factor 1 subunit A
LLWHKPLIQFLDISDKTLAALSKSIQTELVPTTDDNDAIDISLNKSILPLKAIEACIKSVAVRKNYGLDSNGTGKVPASLCVWRWEVNHEYHKWLPKNVQDKVEARLAERAQVNCLQHSLYALSMTVVAICPSGKE